MSTLSSVEPSRIRGAAIRLIDKLSLVDKFNCVKTVSPYRILLEGVFPLPVDVDFFERGKTFSFFITEVLKRIPLM